MRAGLAPSMAALLALAAGRAEAGCAIGAAKCYEDANSNRLLGPKGATSPMQPMTREVCAQICSNKKQKMAGVEYGKQCYCGNALNRAGVASTKCTMACAANSSETCGGSDAIDVFEFSCSGTPVPIPSPSPSPGPSPPSTPFAFHGCTDSKSKAMPYCDSTKSDKERVESILKGLSLADKIALGSPTHKPFCECHTAPIASQSLPDCECRNGRLGPAGCCRDSDSTVSANRQVADRDQLLRQLKL